MQATFGKTTWQRSLAKNASDYFTRHYGKSHRHSRDAIHAYAGDDIEVTRYPLKDTDRSASSVPNCWYFNGTGNECMTNPSLIVRLNIGVLATMKFLTFRQMGIFRVHISGPWQY